MVAADALEWFPIGGLTGGQFSRAAGAGPGNELESGAREKWQSSAGIELGQSVFPSCER